MQQPPDRFRTGFAIGDRCNNPRTGFRNLLANTQQAGADYLRGNSQAAAPSSNESVRAEKRTPGEQRADNLRPQQQQAMANLMQAVGGGAATNYIAALGGGGKVQIVAEPVTPLQGARSAPSAAEGVARIGETRELVRAMGRDGKDPKQCARISMDVDGVLRGTGVSLSGTPKGPVNRDGLAEMLVAEGTITPEAARRALERPTYGDLQSVAPNVPEGGTAIVSYEHPFSNQPGHVTNVVNIGGRIFQFDGSTGTGSAEAPRNAQYFVFPTGQFNPR
jgi:hypothetical protein